MPARRSGWASVSFPLTLTPMTYDEAIAFWYGRINYEVRAAQPEDMKLERMRALLRLLGDPHDRVRLVHVTGTKGKGSTAAMIANVVRAAGYRVGLFTSPHLSHVEERVQVDGVPITPAELAARMAEIAAAVAVLERGDGNPGITFFEIGTALGFLHFCRRRTDFAVVEVGLGGRFDSTNVCTPLVSVITSVGLDHTAQLGDTLEAIAYQKAGIVKPRVPVVSGASEPGPRAVIRRVAAEMRAPLWELGDHFGYDRIPVDGGSHATIRTPRSTDSYRVGLLGLHQAHNAAVAVATVDRLRDTGMPIADAAIARGLSTVAWPGRIEVLSRSPVVILDTAHNVPSAEALVRTLRETFPAVRRKAVVFAVSSDKPWADILRTLGGYFDHFHLTRYGNNPRCVPPEALAGAVGDGVTWAVHAAGGAAWETARAGAGPDDLVCVTGSVFLAGELRAVMTTGEP